MTWLRYLAGVIVGALVGYGVGLGLFWAVDELVMPVSLDAGWGFVEVGILVGIVLGIWIARRRRRPSPAA